MKKSLKKIFITVQVMILCMSIFYSNCSDGEDVRLEALRNFTTHEKEFDTLVTTFHKLCDPVEGKIVAFGLTNKNDIYDISAFPLSGSVSKTNPIIGGARLKLGSAEMNQVLDTLGWSEKNVVYLGEKLSKTNCLIISTSVIYGQPISVFYRRSGFGEFSYLSFDSCLTSELIKIHGEAISKSEIGCKTVLKFTSGL